VPVPVAHGWARGKLAVLLVTVLILHGITFANADLAMKVQLASLREEAGATALRLAPPRVPDRANAAAVYQQAFEAMTPMANLPARWREIEATGPSFDVTALDPKDKDLRTYLSGQKRVLALLRQAAAMPDCYFEHNYVWSTAVLFPEMEHLLRGARLLAADARAQYEDGNRQRAWEDVGAIFGMARHVNDPILLSLLMAASLDRIGLQTLEDLLARAPPRPGDLALVSLDGPVSYHQRFERALQLEEAVWGLTSFAMAGTDISSEWYRQLVGQTQEQDLTPVLLSSSIWRVFFLPDDLAHYRRVMKRMQKLAALPYHVAHPHFEEVENSFRTEQQGVITRLLTPSARVADAVAEADARRQLGRVALAVTGYRLKQKKYPDKLEDLVPEYLAQVPLDPFDGMPLRGKRVGDDLVLFSIGRDQKDDGGVPWDSTKGEGDLLFRLRGR
jgi:hypothetical protein